MKVWATILRPIAVKIDTAPLYASRPNAGRSKMDKNRIAGSIKEIKGEAKAAIGKVVGDAKLQSEGKIDIAAGKAQNAVGGASDAMRDVANKQ